MCWSIACIFLPVLWLLISRILINRTEIKWVFSVVRPRPEYVVSILKEYPKMAIYHLAITMLNREMINWLIIYCFTSRSRIFHWYGDVTIAGEGLQKLGLCSALRVFEQGGIFIVPHLLWHGTSGFPVIWMTVPLSRLLRHTRGNGESILIRILTDEQRNEMENNQSKPQILIG
jgi:hypothetical protein